MQKSVSSCHLDSLSSIILISAASGSEWGFLRRPLATARGADLASLCKLGPGSFRRVRRSLNRIRLVILADEIPGYVRSRGGVNTDVGVLQTAQVEEVRDAIFGAILIEGLPDLLVNIVGLSLGAFIGKILRILERAVVLLFELLDLVAELLRLLRSQSLVFLRHLLLVVDRVLHRFQIAILRADFGLQLLVFRFQFQYLIAENR